jgi:glycosyltransferase involved in cell wall biosynthesis
LLSVTIPVFNEEGCIERTLRDLAQTLATGQVNFEIIVINNGSTDRTADILQRLAGETPRIRVVHLEQNAGYGGAILEGFRQARGDILGFTCADGEVPASSVLNMARLLEVGGVDVIKGKRIGRNDGWLRILMSFGYHLIVSLLFKIHITDINGYPLVMKRRAYRKLRLNKKDWVINVELLWEARRNHLVIAEIDVPHLPRAGGRSHVRLFFPILFLIQLLKLRLFSEAAAPVDEQRWDQPGAP